MSINCTTSVATLEELEDDHGSGSNPQCLPLDFNFLTPISKDQHWRALMYGAEYETHTVTVTFVDVITLMYHVQFVMSVIVLQSTWFLLSTHALQDGPGSIMDT